MGRGCVQYVLALQHLHQDAGGAKRITVCRGEYLDLSSALPWRKQRNDDNGAPRTMSLPAVTWAACMLSKFCDRCSMVMIMRIKGRVEKEQVGGARVVSGGGNCAAFEVAGR